MEKKKEDALFYVIDMLYLIKDDCFTYSKRKKEKIITKQDKVTLDNKTAYINRTGEPSLQQFERTGGIS